MKISSKSPIKLTESAAKKIKILVAQENNPTLKFRIYIIGGGCNGFQYCFKLDEHVHHDDIIIESCGIKFVVDSLSVQYLIGGLIDYVEELGGSKFKVVNPNVKSTCGCGLSFSI